MKQGLVHRGRALVSCLVRCGRDIDPVSSAVDVTLAAASSAVDVTSSKASSAVDVTLSVALSAVDVTSTTASSTVDVTLAATSSSLARYLLFLILVITNSIYTLVMAAARCRQCRHRR